MFKGSSQPGWGSYVRPVGTTQGAGSVTAVPTYIMWLMAAIPIVEATANIKKHHRKLFFVTLREKSQVGTNFLVVKIPVVPDFTVM